MLAGQVCATENLRAVPVPPSGMLIELTDVILDEKPDQTFVYSRFRFLVPELAKGNPPELEVLARDFEFLCNEFALPIVLESTAEVDRIVISYSDRPVDFGATDPDARQFFEQFGVKNDACIWENY
nr:DUF6497 family protein [Lentibacter algarum]